MGMGRESMIDRMFIILMGPMPAIPKGIEVSHRPTIITYRIKIKHFLD